MIQILAGEKGHGKTKRFLEMTNKAGKSADGHVVFIDKNNKLMYDLDHSVRLIDTSEYSMIDYNVLLGFICGILSRDSDIEKIFIDRMNKIVKKINVDDTVAFINEIKNLSDKSGVDFAMTYSGKPEELPEQIRVFYVEY